MNIDVKKNNGTEDVNEATKNIDMLSIKDILLLTHNENCIIMSAIEKAIPKISKVTEKVYNTISLGGRIIYIGAGTSGRLGVLDASECPPTFSVPNDLFIGIIAGGDIALRNAIEGAEDRKEDAIKDLSKINFNKNDMLIGIAASGKTPYVVGALEYAKKSGAYTAAIVNNNDTIMSKIADETIELITGPEIVSGSTRLKVGTAQKITLNMISTTVMIKLGKVYENLMVDLKPTNEKLKLRATNIVMKIAKVDSEKAKMALGEADGNTKLAIIMLMTNKGKIECEKMLKDANGILKKALIDNGVNL